MNLFLTFSCLVSAGTLVAGSTADELATGNNVLSLYRSNLMMDSILRAKPLEQCDPEETSCENDKLTFCAYGLASITIPCSSLFDNKGGYCDCDKSQCIQNRPLCIKPDSEKCSKEGKMPDPTNCRKFTYCNGITKKTFSCPNGMYYDPKIKSCSTNNTCQMISCNPKKILQYVPFPQSPNYFLFCYFGLGEVRECAQEGYSMQNNKCQFHCKKPGLFTDPKGDNCKKGMWHSCTLSNNLLVRQTYYCEKDGNNQLFFNEKIGLCLPEDVCGSDKPGPSSPSPPPDETG